MKTAVLAVTFPPSEEVALAQTSVNSPPHPQHAPPDGQSVPMWAWCVLRAGPHILHYNTTSGPTIRALGGDAWQPPLIIVPTGNSLTINLTNQLPGAVPTSLVIVGQLGGGLGDTAERKTDPSPNHPPQSLTWPVAGAPGDPTNTPPTQADRVRSFSTEVGTGGTKALTWSSANLRPGTYLIESGTHPSIQVRWDCMESWS
jgi:FtsP/CotA-like multicopper oxidase with cupredoxin domain